MKKIQSTGFHIITTFGTKIVVLIGSFIVSVLLARLLGPKGTGIIAAVFVIPNLVVNFADLGVRQASAYFIGRKIYHIEKVLSSSLFLWLFTSILAIIGVLGVYFKGNYFVEYGFLIVFIALASIPIKLLISYVTGVMQGAQKIGTINISYIISFIVNFLGVIVLVWLLDLGVIGGALVKLLIEIAVLIYLWSILRKICVVKLQYIRPIPQEIIKKGITYSLALFILSLNYRIDIIFLENLTTASEVGIYTVGTTLAELIWQLPAAISLVLFSKSANSRSDEEAYGRASRILRISLPILLIVCLIFAMLSEFFVTLIYGTEFEQSAEVINILLPGVLVITITKILHPDMAARGYPLYGLLAFIGPLIINILLNLIWIPKYGVIGAAWASSISYIIGGLLYAVIYAKKEKLRVKELLFLKKEDITLIMKFVNNTKQGINRTC